MLRPKLFIILLTIFFARVTDKFPIEVEKKKKKKKKSPAEPGLLGFQTEMIRMADFVQKALAMDGCALSHISSSRGLTSFCTSSCVPHLSQRLASGINLDFFHCPFADEIIYSAQFLPSDDH